MNSLVEIAKDLLRASGINKAAEFACKYGVIDAPGWEFTRTRDGCLSDHSMALLRDSGANDLILELGTATLRVSQPLTDAEKKR